MVEGTHWMIEEMKQYRTTFGAFDAGSYKKDKWLNYLIDEMERKDKTISELRERIHGELEVSDQVTQEREELILENEQLQKALEEQKKYKSALRNIVCLNIPMPDEVFNLANDALEGKK